jgi:hypothetical protein
LNSPTPSDIISVSSPCIQKYRSHSLVTTLAYFSLRHLNLYPIINLCNYASFACPLLLSPAFQIPMTPRNIINDLFVTFRKYLFPFSLVLYVNCDVVIGCYPTFFEE